MTHWMASGRAVKEIEHARPGSHGGAELAKAAQYAGLPIRAKLAVFIPAAGNGEPRRQREFDLPQEWWPLVDSRHGMQVVDFSKGEGWASVEVDGVHHRVEIFGLSAGVQALAEHFGISFTTATASRPSRGFTESDRAILPLMRDWIDETGRGVPAAAMEFASQAKGSGTVESKAKRLERAYLKETGERSSLPKTPENSQDRA